MKGAQECSKQCGEPKSLIGSYFQGENAPNQKHQPGNDQHDCGPAEFGPKPKPIAFRMQRPGIVKRCVAEDREYRFKVSKANSAPGRRANKLKSVLKNQPAKIRSEADTFETAEMKPFQRFPAEEKNDRG